LFKEINTKFLNNDPNSNKKNFDVELSDDEKKLIITNNGKTEEYEDFDYRGFRCIHPDFKCIDPDNIEDFYGKDKNKICRIIENDGVNDRKFFLEVELNENKKIMTIDDGNESKEYNISKKEDKKIISLLFKLIYPKNTEKLDEEIIFRIIENIELNNNKKVFSVELNNTEKIFGFKLNKNNKKFDVKLNENEKKLIITNNGETEEYEVFIKTINSIKFKCIHPDFKCIDPDNIKKFDGKIIFRIIENDYQLNSFNSKNNKSNKNFDRCIFLWKIGDLSTNIDFQEGDPSFRYSIFKSDCNLTGVLHNKKEINNSYFENCIFLGKASFSLLIFKHETKNIFPFLMFSGSVFLNEANFMFTKFEDVAFFKNCIFKEANFNGAKFESDAYFDNCIFKKANFFDTKFEKKLSLANANIKKLHLTDVEIKGSLNCDKIKLQKKENEEAFSILKENCIKKYNSISALYLHKKEVEEYRCTLDWKKNFIEKFILSFEKIASNYGTNPFLAMGWLLPLHYIDYVIRDYDKKIYNDLENGGFNIYNLNIMEIIFNPSNPSNLLGFWFLFKIILSSVLIYEIIKSFRMFSRKL
ncbi:MAG: pentapeptide repeat-containing protein, partial [Alphaproteobacteria bacterium]|nr:pentapeptide repeat-containing protein [Alphaproteobacteria bacterium]